MYKNILWYRYNNLCFLTVLYPDVQNLWHLDRLDGKQINEEELRILLISRWVAELAQNKNLIKKNFEHARKNNVLNVFYCKWVIFCDQMVSTMEKYGWIKAVNSDPT